MLIKPFSILFKDQVDPATMSYLGFVEDNKDPEKLGRIKVRIAPYSELSVEELPWVTPKLGSHGNSAEYGGLNVPEIGSQVRVDFPSKDFTAPYYGGAELNNMNRMSFFDEDYPNTYGYKDSVGNFLKVNKERGTIHAQHFTTTNVQVAPEGSIRVSLSNGAYFILDNSNSFELNIGSLDISGMSDGSLEIKSNNEISAEAGTIYLKAKVVEVDGDFKSKKGASGSFVTLGNFVTVENGLITSIQ